MTVDQVFIIKKLQNLDEMLVAYSGKSAEKGCIDVLHESVCHGNQ